MRDQFNQWRGKAKTGSMPRGPLDTPSHRIGRSSLAPDGASFRRGRSKDSFQARVVQSWRRVWERSTARSAA